MGKFRINWLSSLIFFIINICVAEKIFSNVSENYNISDFIIDNGGNLPITSENYSDFHSLSQITINTQIKSENYYAYPGYIYVCRFGYVYQIDNSPKDWIPYPTYSNIQDAVKAVPKKFWENFILYVHKTSSNYNEIINITSKTSENNHRIFIQSYKSNEKPVIFCNSNYVIKITNADSITFQNFIVMKGNLDGIIIKDSKNIFLKNIFLKSNGNGFFLKNVTNSSLENNIFFKNSENGIKITLSSNCIIKNNTFYSNNFNGIIITNQNKAISIKNNIIAKNNRYGIYVDKTSYNDTISDYNNCYKNKVGFGYYNTNSCAILIDWYKITSNGLNSMEADPQFVNTGKEDFHLLSTAGYKTNNALFSTWLTSSGTNSPCIDAGDASSFSKEPAPNGSKINLGAYGNTFEASKSDIAGQPQLVVYKEITNISLNSSVITNPLPGCTIKYCIVYSNKGKTAAVNTIIFDKIFQFLSYKTNYGEITNWATEYAHINSPDQSFYSADYNSSNTNVLWIRWKTLEIPINKTGRIYLETYVK